MTKIIQREGYIPMSNIIVISGPSGSGKSTLIRLFMKEHQNIIFSTSHTTRQRRENEIEGKDYHFVKKSDFIKIKQRDEFVECAQVHGNWYGTSWEEIDVKRKINKTVILDIDVQGAQKIKERFSDALFILIVPPNLEELEKRLLNRERRLNGSKDAELERRLKIAKDELKQYKIYDYLIFNDKIGDALNILNSIYIAYMNSTILKKQHIEDVLGSKK